MRAAPFAILLTSWAACAIAAEVPPGMASAAVQPGHSMNGEVFNEGPRQAAILMPGTGDVSFPITSSHELAQKFFNQGVGQLHGFWYFEAERSFRQVAAIDPDCAIAYWGLAMANINNPERAAKFIKEATARKAKGSRREQLWIDSLAAYHAESKQSEKERREALITSLEELSFEFPQDLEAKAFLVFQLWDNKGHGVPLSSRKAVDAIAREVLAANPQHPGVHHYRIHLWNGNKGDQRALDSAGACGQSAPGIAHMWHMSGHTFSNLKRYADAAWQQEASARVDHAHTMAARILPDQIHNFAHNNDWLVKDLAYIGRVHDAIDLAKNMIELPRIGSKSGTSYKLGRDRLVETLLRFELWDEIAGLEGQMYFTPEETGERSAALMAAIGVARYRRGERTAGDTQVATLERLLEDKRQKRIKAADEAEAKAQSEKKTDDQIAAAMASALRRASSGINEVQAALTELQVYRTLAEGKKEAAKAELAKAANLPAERRARLAFETGDVNEAEKLARDAVKADDQQAPALATLADILWRGGKKPEALATCEALRKISAQIDLDVPLFAQLAPIAQELKWPTDWRPALTFPADSGERPELATLGPFRWQPTPAPSWSLPDSSGKNFALTDFRGEPLLVVFYLGSGCPHCIEQLNVFSPVTKDFAAAGIKIVAVSTDSADGLYRTFAHASASEGFPFPILADPSLATFKAYRVFDDFEHMPLHGTFLVDGTGRIRWQDIGYQPFRDTKWLLGESKRLLSVPLSTGQQAAISIKR